MCVPLSSFSVALLRTVTRRTSNPERPLERVVLSVAITINLISPPSSWVPAQAGFIQTNLNEVSVMRKLCAALLLFLLFFLSGTGRTLADSRTIVGRLANGGAVLTGDQGTLQALYNGAVEELGQGTIVDSLYLELYGSQWYLIATGTAVTLNGTESRMVGAPLNPDAGGNLRFASNRVKHSCTGAPCSKCRFTKDSFGDIDGCACGVGSQCNHGIETTNQSGWFGANIY